MKIFGFIILGGLAASVFLLASDVIGPELFTVHAKVIDQEDRMPIENAIVSISHVPGGETAGKTLSKKILTDREGRASVEVQTYSFLQAKAKAEGWYWGWSPQLQTYESEGPNKRTRVSEHSITINLRRIKSPIPLCARKLTLEFPAKDQWFGFDFEAGDWIAPNGVGSSADIFFRVQAEYVDSKTASGTLEINFPNKGDGILAVDKSDYLNSELTMPYQAPESGYQSSWSRHEETIYNKNKKPNTGYFMRVRSQSAGDEITQANYVKITEEIDFDPRETGWHIAHKDKPKTFSRITFTYYFNPTPNDPNLEFAPEKNLFENLEPAERVTSP